MKHYLTILPYLCIGFCIGAIATLFFLTKPPYQTYICGKIKYIQIGSSVINYTEDSLTLENELSDRDDTIIGSGTLQLQGDIHGTPFNGKPVESLRFDKNGKIVKWDADTLYYKKW